MYSKEIHKYQNCSEKEYMEVAHSAPGDYSSACKMFLILVPDLSPTANFSWQG